MLSPRVRAQILKELLSILRDPKTRLLLIVPPLMQLLIFSFAATLEVRNIDVAILNRDAGRWGHELTQRLSHAWFVHEVVSAGNERQVADLIEQGRVLAALHVPETFSRDLTSGRRAAIQGIFDGRHTNTAQIAYGYLQSVLETMNADMRQQGVPDPGEAIALRHWFNPNLIYLWFMVPSIGGTLVMFSTLMIAALSIARERENGTFDQLLVSPCTPLEIIFAKLVPAILVGALLGLVILLAGVGLFGIPFRGHLVLLLSSMGLFILSVVGIGLMISSVCNTQQQAILGTFSIGVPAVLMSGFATPIENMPPILQVMAEGIPLKHYLIIVQGSFLKALPPGEVLAHAWPLAVIAVFTLSASIVVVRRNLH